MSEKKELSDALLKSITLAKGKRYFPDRDGMYAYVCDDGTKQFRYDYRWPATAQGRRQRIIYGNYPVMTLAEAREAHSAALKLKAQGVNPAEQRQEQKQAHVKAALNTFKACAEEWRSELLPQRSRTWAMNTARWLDVAYAYFGNKPIGEVTTPEVKAVIRSIADDGKPHSANAARKVCALVFDHAGRMGLISNGHNPARVRNLIQVPKTKHRAYLQAHEIPAFVVTLEQDCGTEQTKAAAKLLLLTFVRINELLKAHWSEVDLERAIWELPAERTKTRVPHIVPLSGAALAIFRRLKELAGNSALVFPNRRDPRRPMSAAAINKQFERMGYQGKLDPHGVRASASTALNERGWKPQAIERQLAHTDKDRIAASYNHAEHLSERVRIMEAWARICQGKPGSPADVPAEDHRLLRAVA